MISNVLKDLTKQSHQSLEKSLSISLKNIRTTDDYIFVLHLFYSFLKGVEKEAELAGVAEIVPDYSRRRKTSRLAHDLEALGAKSRTMELCPDVPEIRTAFQAAGALYVMEGSTLGGQIISRMIRDRLPLLNDNALSFFNGYGQDTLTMWETFKQRIDTLPLTAEQEGEMTGAAEATFKLFKNWIVKNNEQKELRL